MKSESITRNGNGKKERIDNLPFDASSMLEGTDFMEDKCTKIREENVNDGITAEIVKSVVEALRRKRGK